MKVVAIIQARLNSTRLPGKMLLPLGGKPLIQNVCERVKRATSLDAVVLTYPEHDADALWDGSCSGVTEFPYDGDEHDLVGRYLAAAKSEDADIILRIPGDNPCVDPACIDAAVFQYLSFPWIFYSNTTDQVGSTAVDGIGCEVFSYSRLQWLDRMTKHSPIHREHPHRYFLECMHAYSGAIHIWVGGAPLRLDVNTSQDYEFVKMIYDHFGGNQFTTEDVLTYLKEVPHEASEQQQPIGHA